MPRGKQRLDLSRAKHRSLAVTIDPTAAKLARLTDDPAACRAALTEGGLTFRDAELRAHLQAWQLRQLAPQGARAAPPQGT